MEDLVCTIFALVIAIFVMCLGETIRTNTVLNQLDRIERSVEKLQEKACTPINIMGVQ